MESEKYIIFNGEPVMKNKPVFTVDNRAFRYGDSVFETIRYHKGSPLFFDDHYRRLTFGMDILGMDISSLPDEETLKKQITFLVNKNRIFKDARIRLSVFRNGGGLYTPENNDVSYVVEAAPLDGELYSPGKKGLIVGLFDRFYKSSQELFSFKNSNSLVYILGGIYKRENMLDDCLIMNDKGSIIEALSSNLFWIKDEKVFTPALSSGCVNGIMRKQVLVTIEKAGLPFKETPGTTIEEIKNADEVFLTNAINGIRRVTGIDEKRYYSVTTKKIFNALMSDVLQMLEDEQ